MAKPYSSPFLEAFKILPWETFDDGASGSVFKVVGKVGVSCPVSGVAICGSQFIVKLVSLPSGPGDSSEKKLREVELLKETRIEDENVVRIFGSWEERPPLGFEYPNRPPVNHRGARLLFILMEYCNLFTLRKWLGWPREKRSWEDLVNIFVQVTKGLVAIHLKGIIHRDLKPSNVGLTCHWTEERVIAKLIDFGLATKQSDEMTSKVGTHHYRSPENHSGRVYDEKADVYTLGIILCQMIASLMAANVTFAQLEEEFRQFVDEQMTSSFTLSPFDVPDYLKKYGVSSQDGRVDPQVIQLTKEMTCHLPQERLSSLKILERIREIIPETESHVVSIYNYLEELKERQVCLSFSNCADLRPIKTSRLNHLTHLTLKNIRVTRQQLLETVGHCLALKHLSLSLLITDLRRDEVLQMHSISIPSLQTFRFRVHTSGEDDITTKPDSPVDEYGAPRMLSLMFFGPLSQIWENRMRVKISCGKRVLVDIDAGEKLIFVLEHIKDCYDFLEILNKVKFQDVKLDSLSGKNKEDVYLNNFWLDENKAAVYELDLFLPKLDVMEGRLFQGFSCLTDLTMLFIPTFPFKTLQISLLPETLNRLNLKWVRLCVDGMTGTNRRSLKFLVLSDCEVPVTFYEKYDTLFQVEAVYIFSLFVESDPNSVLPGISYVEKVFNTSNWRKMNLDPFDWKLTEENSDFREELLSSFFATEDEESLKNKGIILELIEGNAVARLVDEFQYGSLTKRGSGMLSARGPVDSDDEEGPLMVQQDVADKLERLSNREIVHVGLEELDSNLEEVFVLKGTLSYPTYPENGWDSKVIFEKFGGISKDKPKLKHIQLKNCSLSSSLSIQLKGCVNLESLEMDMVEWESESVVKMTSKFPALKKYVVNLYAQFLPGGVDSRVFPVEKFDQLWFFRPGPQRIKGLWGKGIECRVSVQGTSYFQLDKDSLTLQFLPNVHRIINLLELSETLKTLSIQCCLLKLPCEGLPTSITKLTLRYVEATFRHVCERAAQLKSLETLIFEGRGDYIYVDVDCIKDLPSLKHLTLCNVSVCGLLNKVQIRLDSCTLNRVKLDSFTENGKSFNETFPIWLNTESLILADGVDSCFNYGTLHSVLTIEDVCIRNVLFINYERSIGKDAVEADLVQHSLCESFLTSHEILIVSTHFQVQLGSKSSRNWRASEIFPDDPNNTLLESYMETKSFFPEDDAVRRTNNLKHLWDRQILPEGDFSV